MMNYFEFYEIPVSFRPNSSELRRKFLLTSKKYHPDFHTLSSEEEQAVALEKSTFNNQAYKTLGSPEACIKYILELKGALKKGEQGKLPQDFLMEMMDLNEAIMELQFDFEQTAYQKVLTQVTAFEQKLQTTVEPILANSTVEDGHLQPVLDYYYKKRYLYRIRENLAKLEV